MSLLQIDKFEVVLLTVVGASIVNILVAIAFGQPPEPLTVYVIVAVPAAMPVTTPVAETVAIVPSDVVQVPPETVDVNVVFEPKQIACVPDNVPATAGAVTVTVLVADTFGQPPEPLTVYVIVAIPAATPVTTPVAETVAIVPSNVDQVPPACVDEKVVVNPTQIFCIPDNVPATTGAVTVTVLVADTFGQPPKPLTVYVIVAVPAATPVTTPVVETVAIVPSDVDQEPPVCVDENVVVNPTQIFCIPDNVPATTGAVTVTVLVADTFGQPPEPLTVYVIVAVPAATPVTTPVAETVAIVPSDVDQEPPVCVDENVVVEPIQIFCIPDNVPATTGAVTVTVLVAVASGQPPIAEPISV